MPPELHPSPELDHLPPEFEGDPYLVAEAVFEVRREALHQAGWLRSPTELTDAAEADEHFNALADLYRATCLELGLAWPPPPLPSEKISPE